MGKGQKVAVTAILVIVFFLVAGLLTSLGSSKTFIGLLAVGLYYGVKAMFKPAEQDTGGGIVLDKGGVADPTPTEKMRDDV
jgi:hypothetical protein